MVKISWKTLWTNGWFGGKTPYFWKHPYHSSWLVFHPRLVDDSSGSQGRKDNQAQLENGSYSATQEPDFNKYIPKIPKIKSPKDRVVGPLPNGLFMAYKWRLLTTYWLESFGRIFFGDFPWQNLTWLKCFPSRPCARWSLAPQNGGFAGPTRLNIHEIIIWNVWESWLGVLVTVSVLGVLEAIKTLSLVHFSNKVVKFDT